MTFTVFDQYGNANTQTQNYVRKVADADTDGVLVEHKASDWTECQYYEWGLKTGYFVEKVSDGTAKGYVAVTAKKYKYNAGYSNGYGYFVEATSNNGTLYALSNVEKLQYWNGNSVSTGYFTKSSAKKGTKGYVLVENAQEYTYYNNTTDTTSYKGYFTKETATEGTEGYVERSAGSFYSGKAASLEYKAPEGKEDIYYLTPYAFNTTNGTGLINSINSNYTDWLAQTGSASQGKLSKDFGIYVSALSMTALYQSGNDSSATAALPYVYAQQQFQAATAYSMSANSDESANSETVKADMLNEGLVTMYPFSISSSLNISGTHQQAYALDLESSNVTVWYTLAGSNNSKDAKTRSSKYAASPGDAMESYFIYTTAYGSGAITYCGAGHSSVTGRMTRNNDERKLFINVIVNSAAAVPEMPVIKLYEPTGTFDTEDELGKDEDAVAESGKTVYQIDVDSKTDTPEFDMKITIPEKTKVTKVNVYYDLNYDDTDFSNRPVYEDKSDDYDGDVMIKSFTSKGTTSLTDISGTITDLVRKGDTDKLQLQDDYFAPYGGNYTYIAVEVYYQGKTAPVYVMIKVKASDPLFDLTENNIDVPQTQDFIAEKKNIFA
jgi:hypothetical protein